MSTVDLVSREFIGIIVPGTQTSISDSGGSVVDALAGKSSKGFTNFMQVAPILYNASFDPCLRAASDLLSTLDSTFSGAISTLKKKGISTNIASLKNGTTYPSSPIDFSGGGSRYLVHIPELMPFIDSLDGIWCHSAIGNTQANKNNTKLISDDDGGSIFEPIGKIFGGISDISDSIDSITNTVNGISSDLRNSLDTIVDTFKSFSTFEPFVQVYEHLESLGDSVSDEIKEAAYSLGELSRIEDYSPDEIQDILSTLSESNVDELMSYVKNSMDIDLPEILLTTNIPEMFSNTIETISSLDISRITSLSFLQDIGGWAMDFSVSDVVDKISSSVDGALGLVSGGFLNFTLNSGAEMSPSVGDSNSGSFGSIPPGTKVVIKFSENDLNSAQIVRLIPYDSQTGPVYSKYKSSADDMADLYPQLYSK